jgi:hypothetical protein
MPNRYIFELPSDEDPGGLFASKGMLSINTAITKTKTPRA